MLGCLDARVCFALQIDVRRTGKEYSKNACTRTNLTVLQIELCRIVSLRTNADLETLACFFNSPSCIVTHLRRHTTITREPTVQFEL